MGFISRLLGRQQDSVGSRAVHTASNKRQQPSSPHSGTFAPECWTGRSSPPAAAAVKLQNVQAPEPEIDSEDDEMTNVRVPGSHSSSGTERRQRSGSLTCRRRAAIDISPAAVQRLATQVAVMEAAGLRASLDEANCGIMHTEVELLYTDMQLIHRGRSSMVYRAREVGSGRRIVLKAYDSLRLTPSKRTALDRHLRALRAAQNVCGTQDGVVVLERVVQDPSGMYLVMQACNGGTLIEAIANSGGKLHERQVAMKVALPMLKTLSRLHANGIVHRDIKPEHLMIHNGSIKLGDFGSAGCIHGVEHLPGLRMLQLQHPAPCLAEDPKQQLQGVDAGPTVNVTVAACSTSSCGEAPCAPAAGLACPIAAVKDAMNYRTGSIEYTAPEMLNKPTAAEVFHLVIGQGIDEDDLPCYNEKVDVWSLGVVLYEALSGIQPFLADTAADMAAVIGTKLSQQTQQQQQQKQQPGQQQHGEPQPMQVESHHHQQQQQQGSIPAFIDRLPVSADCKSFVAACLSADPEQRPSASQLLQHRWLQVMQEQAAAVAAAKAASRRTSLQQGPPGQLPGHPGAAAGSNLAAGSSLFASGGTPSSNAASAAAAAAAQAGEAAGSSSSSLLAVHTAGGRPQHAAIPGLVGTPEEEEEAAAGEAGRDGARMHRTATGLFESSESLSRSQTQISLEIGVQSVLRTHTQRLDGKGLHARVFNA